MSLMERIRQRWLHLPDDDDEDDVKRRRRFKRQKLSSLREGT